MKGLLALHRAVLGVSTTSKSAHRSIACSALCASGSALPSDRPLRVSFVGAGGINFGSQEGPWNHAARLERIPGVQFSGIVDINADLAQQRVEEYRGGANPEAWQETQVFTDYQDLLCSPAKPDAVFIGLPPKYHGGLQSSADIELQMARAGVHLFVEKPVSIRPADEVMALSRELEALQREKGLIIGVGYMLRYSPAVEAMKRKLQEHGKTPAAVVGLYNSAYSYISKRDYWDMELSGGPIVEQATHFVDLMRFLGGEIEEDSIRAIAMGPSYPLGDMPASPGGEHKVPPERRINRATNAMFHFESGAIGTLTHSVVLHEDHYFTAIEVLADGLHVRLENPYNSLSPPQLTFRGPHSNEYQQLEFDTSQDMYAKEVEAFVAAVRTADPSKIRSSYADAVRSYVATQWIKREALKDRRAEGEAAPKTPVVDRTTVGHDVYEPIAA